jgi:hypothetical protein
LVVRVRRLLPLIESDRSVHCCDLMVLVLESKKKSCALAVLTNVLRVTLLLSVYKTLFIGILDTMKNGTFLSKPNLLIPVVGSASIVLV